MDKQIDNPCKECIVLAMCEEYCELYEDYVGHIIRDLCGFTITPSFNVARDIKVHKNGSLRLAGLVGKRKAAITVDYKDCEIYDIYDRETFSTKRGKKIYSSWKKL
jgi:hypothetical protein